MLITLTGRPGKGKTLTLVSIAYKNFIKKNPPLKVWWTEKIKRKPYVYDLSEYSDFPICFKKAKKGKIYYIKGYDSTPIPVSSIFSLKCRIFDLILENKFLPSANFYFDEIQAKYDSMDYKDFPDCIAHYMQAHRHFDNNIYTDSQSQSRIIKRILVLSEEYWNIEDFRKFFGIAICNIRCTWEKSASLEDNSSNNLISDFDYFRRFFRLKKIGSMYDSKYLRFLQEDSKPYKIELYNSLTMTKEDLLTSFFPSEQEKERLKHLRY